ncbi:unnamed protein product [Symbiodinium sp. CCMP2592]|nr:unnamed protein product [Symbiodinium sp. CCMP2592]
MAASGSRQFPQVFRRQSPSAVVVLPKEQHCHCGRADFALVAHVQVLTVDRQSLDVAGLHKYQRFKVRRGTGEVSKKLVIMRLVSGLLALSRVGIVPAGTDCIDSCLGTLLRRSLLQGWFQLEVRSFTAKKFVIMQASAPRKLLDSGSTASAVVSRQLALVRVGIVPSRRRVTKASCHVQNNLCDSIATDFAVMSCDVVCGIKHLIRCSLFVCPRVKSLALRSCGGLPFGPALQLRC